MPKGPGNRLRSGACIREKDLLLATPLSTPHFLVCGWGVFARTMVAFGSSFLFLFFSSTTSATGHKRHKQGQLITIHTSDITTHLTRHRYAFHNNTKHQTQQTQQTPNTTNTANSNSNTNLEIGSDRHLTISNSCESQSVCNLAVRSSREGPLFTDDKSLVMGFGVMPAGATVMLGDERATCDATATGPAGPSAAVPRLKTSEKSAGWVTESGLVPQALQSLEVLDTYLIISRW